MFQLTTPAGKFGPYYIIETLGDRYRLDGTDMPFTVVGKGTVAVWDGVADVPPPIVPVVPQSITRAQAKLALLQAGLLDMVQPAIDSIPNATERQAAQIEWDDRLTFDRKNGALVTMASLLGMTDSQIDGLFILGATL